MTNTTTPATIQVPDLPAPLSAESRAVAEASWGALAPNTRRAYRTHLAALAAAPAGWRAPWLPWPLMHGRRI